MKHDQPKPALPAWFRQRGESYRDWSARNAAERERVAAAKLKECPKPLDPLYAGSLDLAVGVGTYDANGNPKGSGWW